MKKIFHSLFMVLLVQFAAITQTFAEGIEINHVESHLENGTYYLTANIQYRFSEEAIEALEHGVPLFINIDIKTQKERPYIWDEIISKSTIQYRLEYHPLSQRYLLTELNRLTRRDFHHLSSALNSLGEISNWPITREKELNEAGTYRSFLRAKLDINSLPASLRPIALISSKWQLASGWYSWVLKS